MRSDYPILAMMAMLAGTVPGRTQTIPDSPVVQLEAFTVSGSRVTANEVEGPQALNSYDPAFIESSGAFSVKEFIGSLPDTDDGTTTLVLIDGRPTYLDPASLPIGMIAEIEVSRDGSMPKYGEFHDGRIINIRLKTDYTSRELGAKFQGAWAGGRFERTLRFAGATNRKKLRAIYSLELTENEPLLATQRDFSREQDHRDDGGRDLRLAWGQPAVIAARAGVLDGVTDAAGNPVRTALVPSGQNGEGLTPANFLPPDPSVGDRASGQQRFNTAPYRWLVSPSRSLTFSLGFTYSISERLRLSINGSHLDLHGERLGPPPVTATSENTVVPAAFNPFNQDVSVGMVHESFGPTHQDTQGQRDQIGIELDGDLAEGWRWEASIGYRRNTAERTGEDLDPAKFAAALADDDPARRFNPFADTRHFDPNASLYPQLTSTRASSDASDRLESELALRGTAFDLVGGPSLFALKGRLTDTHRERISTRVLGQEPERDDFDETGQRLSGSLQVPFVGKANASPGLRRLEGHLAGKYESSSDDSREIEGDARVLWAPLRSLLLRARVDQSTANPASRVIAGSETLIGETLIDPRRGGETVTAVRVFNRETVAAGREKQQRYSVGLSYEPPAVRGLELKVNYRERIQSGIFQSKFEAQDIVSNERAFADRVQRDEPTAADLAAGRPGRIAAVDLTPGGTGEAARRDVEFQLDYRLAERPSGRWRFTAEVDRNLSAQYYVIPGVPYIAEGRSRYRRPPWQADARVAWSRDQWNASVRLRHSEALPATGNAFNGIGSSTTMDLNLGRIWQLHSAGFGGGRQNLKVVLSVDNLFDQAPPRADTVTGYRGGSPLGRTYGAALTLDF